MHSEASTGPSFCIYSKLELERSKCLDLWTYLSWDRGYPCTASILEFPSKEIQGKCKGNLQQVSIKEILTHGFPVGNLFLLSLQRKSTEDFLGSRNLLLFLGYCRFSWDRKSNNSSSDGLAAPTGKPLRLVSDSRFQPVSSQIQVLASPN